MPALYYDPYDFDIDADPHPVWRRMREEAPLYRNDTYDFWALSRWADVSAALTAYGIFTDNLGVLWGNVATLTVGFAFAASRATGDRFGDPEVRRALYVLVPAVVALIGGYFSVDVALWTSLAMAILGAALAWRNVDPDEQKAADYRHKRLEGE